MIRALALFSVFALLTAGCGSDNGATAEDEHVHAVICGCALEEVGACGEYIDVDGKWVELTGDLGLGDMPFCKKDGLKAHVHGEMKDGKYVATEFDYVN